MHEESHIYDHFAPDQSSDLCYNAYNAIKLNDLYYKDVQSKSLVDS